MTAHTYRGLIGHTKAAGRTAVSWDEFAIVASAVVGLICGIAQATGAIHIPFDARFYWDAGMPTPYHAGPAAYAYPPPLAQLVDFVRPLGWPVFIVAWTTLLFASLGYLLGRWVGVAFAFGLVALVVPAVPAEPLASALIGNVTLPMAAAIRAGMHHPAWWAVPLLTKMTVGVGVLWFAFRGEWRRFGIALAATAGVALVSFALAPGAWSDFVSIAVANAGSADGGLPGAMPIVGPPLLVRLAVAVALIAWGARTDRPWVVPLACAISLVGLYGVTSMIPIAIAAVRPLNHTRR